MKSDDKHDFSVSRRGFLTRAAGLALTTGAGLCAHAKPDALAAIKNGSAAVPTVSSDATEPFWGEHQGGIATAQQNHSYFAALDLVATDRADVIRLLKAWTVAAARLSAGQLAEADDSGETLGLPPSHLTITFGFGPGLFIKDGKDRYGLAADRPAALIDLPKFTGDQLVDSQTGGDLSVQACADDPQVAFHAVRQLVRMAYDTAQLRWVQSGFMGNFGSKETARNLMGFRDGSNNLNTRDQGLMNRFVWVGDEGPAWMRGGSYMVSRRIRIALEHWDRMKRSFQEQTIGREKLSGAPLGSKSEFDKADYEAVDKDGNPVIPENAHVRLVAAAQNDGMRILRRSYNYNDGANFTAERWPPWRQEMEYDAGLFFQCYQRDPRTGFVKVFENMAKFDMMNQFITHIGSGLFACPGQLKENTYLGQSLFEKS